MVSAWSQVKWCGVLLAVSLASAAVAQTAAKPGATSREPIQISSDKLDVLQAEHKAIFTGNVIAVQGTSTMRAAEMVVFYTDSTSTPEAGGAGGPQGITRIEAMGSVVYTTPAETAQGDKAVYVVATNTIDLTGANVTLTREKNVLKGTALTYNMDTGRSVLTGGGAVGGKPTRVQGLFVPKADEKKAGTP